MTLHQIVTQARHARCACGAAPERDCPCGAGGVCLSRVARARASRLITAADLAAAAAVVTCSPNDFARDWQQVTS